jgi:tRNA U34 2-thiouridine synthase MnmA/TrmU
MNPCIDCRILLFKKARELMRQEGASFVITGEVLGQRPMSQMRATMRLIEKEAQLTDLVLRPLSAKVLEPTIPEKEGWVPREKLLGLSGRGRKEQFALAGAFGIKDFPCPSGGCLLTDPEFSKRLKDLMRHDHGFTLNDIALLKLGRHFRLDKAAKLIVGRDEEENNQLLNLVLPQDQVLMATPELAGPTAVGRGAFSDELTAQACRIVARYCDRNGNNAVEIIYYKVQDRQEQLKSVLPFEETGLAALRI